MSGSLATIRCHQGRERQASNPASARPLLGKGPIASHPCARSAGGAVVGPKANYQRRAGKEAGRLRRSIGAGLPVASHRRVLWYGAHTKDGRPALLWGVVNLVGRTSPRLNPASCCRLRPIADRQCQERGHASQLPGQVARRSSLGHDQRLVERRGLDGPPHHGRQHRPHQKARFDRISF